MRRAPFNNPLARQALQAAVDVDKIMTAGWGKMWRPCPAVFLCGSTNVHRMGGKTQAGMFLCNDCRDKFTVRTGSVFERSHIPLHKWLLATHLMAASKKGMSALQLQRMLALGSYRSAWFMCHRIREAMKPEKLDPLGGVRGRPQHRPGVRRVAHGGEPREVVVAGDLEVEADLLGRDGVPHELARAAGRV